MNKLLDASKYVVEHAKHVRIDEEKPKEVAENLY